MPLKSPLADVHIPDTDLWSFLFVQPRIKIPVDRVLFIDPPSQRQHTYGSVKKATDDFARALKAKWNWKKGDVFAVYSPNHIDYVVPLVGGPHAGGAVSPVSASFGVDEVIFQLKDSRAKALVTHPDVQKVALAAAKACDIPVDRILFFEPPQNGTGQFQTVQEFCESGASAGPVSWDSFNSKKDVVYLPYSSGTTGKPKGVCLSHRNMIANLVQMTTAENEGPLPDTPEENSAIAFLPFSHIYALNVMLLRSLFRGATFILLKKFTLPDFCSLVQQYRTTLAIVAPPIVLALAKVPDVAKYDLTSLRTSGIISAAAPLSKELIDAFWTRLRIPIKQGMGMTEAAPCTQVQTWSDCMQYRGSVGKLVPNASAKIIAVETASTDSPRELGPGEAGELWFRGPNVFLGYLNRPDATADCVTRDGYYRTGDIGYVDEQGNFYVTDRLKELIKYKGFQVPPAELEALLLASPKVVDAGVIGVWREDQASEVPLAFVVPVPGAKRDKALEEEIAKWVADRAAPYKRLRGGVRFVDAIPKNPTGKILRRVLRDQVQAEAAKAKAKL